MGLSAQFITPQGEKNLLLYKYSGSDKSLLYRFFFSPTAQFLVDRVIPSWLAPNVITLLGFFCTLIPHFIILFYQPLNLSGEIPRWVCFLAAIGQLFYMILDNADGKQARKTKSSSPLGLLFDHGCDAMNTFISGLSVFTVVQFGNTALPLYAYMIGMTGFFLATWEEYYVGSLDLPLINGANEGVVAVIVLFIVSGIFGTQIWNTQVGPLKANEIVLLGFVAMFAITLISNLINVFRRDRTRFLNALSNLLMIIYINATIMIVYRYSVTDVVSRSARILIYFIGFSFAKLVGHLQASHVADEEFQQWRKTMIFSLTTLNVLTLIGHFTGKPLFDEDKVLLGCFIYSFIVYLHFAVSVTSQFAKILKIYVFKIGAREEPDGLKGTLLTNL
jgi:ethanolaminephosphotransferase